MSDAHHPGAPDREGGSYRGGELDIFEHAVRWKRYWADSIAAYLGGRCLEVGAGRGNNTALLFERVRAPDWVCVEPDAELRRELRARLDRQGLAEVRVEAALPEQSSPERFDTILYIDVLEHIEDDRGELRRAAELLAPGGHLIVVAPAHAFLFSEFDASIGHHRRYSLAALRDRTPPGCELVAASYLDSAGILASLANRLLLRQSLPTRSQIETWDRFLVPVSRWLDRLSFGRLGKSVRAIWKRSG